MQCVQIPLLLAAAYRLVVVEVLKPLIEGFLGLLEREGEEGRQ